MNTNYFLTKGNRENEGYRIFLELEGRALRARRRRAPPSRVVQGPAESFVFFVPSVCVLSASNSSPRSCAFVSIGGLDFVNLPRQTRLRGIAVRMSRTADNQMLDSRC